MILNKANTFKAIKSVINSETAYHYITVQHFRGDRFMVNMSSSLFRDDASVKVFFRDYEITDNEIMDFLIIEEFEYDYSTV